MVSVPLTWTIKINGGQEAKTTLNDLNAAFKRGEIAKEDYNKALVRGNRVANQSLNIDRYQANILKAQYPNLMRVSRAMSTVTSISRTLLTISNALNISKIANNTQDLEVMNITKELNELKRLRNEKEALGLTQGKDWYNLLEEIKIKEEELKQKNQEIIDQKWDNMFTNIQSVLFGIGDIFTNLMNNPKIFNALMKAGGFFGGIFGGFFTWVSSGIIKAGSFITSALGIGSPAGKGSALAGTRLGTVFGLSFVGGFAAAIAGILTGALIGAISFPEIDRQLRQMFPGYAKYAEYRDTDLKQQLDKAFGVSPDTRKGLDELDKSRDVFGNKGTVEPLVKQEDVEEQASFFQPLIDLFTKGVPEAIRILQEGFTAGWTGITSMTNVFGANLVAGVNSIFKSLIDSMNSAISAYNRAARKMGRSTIPMLSFTPNAFKEIPMPTVKAATGFDGMVNRPTMFLAGEAGPEQVSISPNGRTSSGNTIIINVAGSVVTEKKIAYMVDQYQKQNLKSRGFTGFG